MGFYYVIKAPNFMRILPNDQLIIHKDSCFKFKLKKVTLWNVFE